MTALNKRALRVPERKRHDWSQAVMRDCDFCSQWALTVKHDDGGCICASCCDAEYTSELKGALEVAIDRAEAAEKRIAELETRAISIPEVRITVAESKRKNLTWRELGAYNEGADVAKEAILAVIRAAGIGVKGE
ncbi:small VCP/p97-interacting protein [Citrobacter sp. Cf122]|uniref:small VCP/p97-interacting protein n=1 Tax=Citrobacter sp. Cf122 TaxID=2985072 RepID=UPI0025773DF0|nr:small VCP/p97-interacting protein [Citrobacter sp. Cf122]MDM3155767.1 small VCP/p97-interacting protein [Citrobacter sp. Cf122]